MLRESLRQIAHQEARKSCSTIIEGGEPSSNHVESSEEESAGDQSTTSISTENILSVIKVENPIDKTSTSFEEKGREYRHPTQKEMLQFYQRIWSMDTVSGISKNKGPLFSKSL